MSTLKIEDAQSAHGERHQIIWAVVGALIVRSAMNDDIIHGTNPGGLVSSCDAGNAAHLLLALLYNVCRRELVHYSRPSTQDSYILWACIIALLTSLMTSGLYRQVSEPTCHL